ncbi:hypothetical protein J6590_067787 [Homalodisca vitripennis]|nr:hypothetical protein J6590_067787 [Homalodisca vitripennis]
MSDRTGFSPLGEFLSSFTDQLFTGTGTGYCSERSDTFGEATALLSVHCSSRSTWLANSTTFGRVPVSAVSGTGAASLPTALKPTECPRPASAIGPASNRSVVLPLISSGTRLDQKCFLLLIPLERIGLYGALPDVRSGGGPVC